MTKIVIMKHAAGSISNLWECSMWCVALSKYLNAARLLHHCHSLHAFRESFCDCWWQNNIFMYLTIFGATQFRQWYFNAFDLAIIIQTMRKKEPFSECIWCIWSSRNEIHTPHDLLHFELDDSFLQCWCLNALPHMDDEHHFHLNLDWKSKHFMYELCSNIISLKFNTHIAYRFLRFFVLLHIYIPVGEQF